MFLDDGDVGVITQGNVSVFSLESGEPVERAVKVIDWSPVMAEKGGHKHFMHKEIFEQPRAIIDTLRGRLAFEEGHVVLDGVDKHKLAGIERIVVTACGTSFHAGLVG